MKIVLVRHGEAEAGWGEHADPGLSEIGRQQAQDVATRLVSRGPLTILTSPLRRCRETAAPLAEKWAIEPVVTGADGEIMSPEHEVTTRGPWLRSVLDKRWCDLPDEQQRWRDAVLACVLRQAEDCVVFTHFVAINVAIGAATADGRVVCRHVANCSTTVLDSDGSSLMLIEAPAEATRTQVL